MLLEVCPETPPIGHIGRGKPDKNFPVTLFDHRKNLVVLCGHLKRSKNFGVMVLAPFGCGASAVKHNIMPLP